MKTRHQFFVYFIQETETENLFVADKKGDVEELIKVSVCNFTVSHLWHDISQYSTWDSMNTALIS